MRDVGKLLVELGIAFLVLGAGTILVASRRVGLTYRLGRLPGDIAVQGKHGSFYFPVVTCILLSVVLTLILWLVQWLKR